MKALLEKDLKADPIEQFALWFKRAKTTSKIEIPEAMCLSTLNKDGFPDGRMVLLKDFDARGFVFYTNLKSLKSRSLHTYPRAGLLFFWESLNRQIRIRGKIELVSKIEADEYFHSRPRLSQLGAWASLQSEVLKSRKELDRRFAVYQKKFYGKTVPRPAHWSGYRVLPQEIEFWQSRPNRLHDRFLYLRKKNGWELRRLYP